MNVKEFAKVIDADKVARELSVPGTEYLNSIKETFGKEVFLENGSLDRKKIASKIYNDKNACDALNKLTFKFVVDEIIRRLEELKKFITSFNNKLLLI